jgi:flavin reductase (DIM6/NTAB) family NADH-FMN oxidoreductase RutF
VNRITGHPPLPPAGALAAPEPGYAPPDRSALRSAFGAFATGITVVTTGRSEPHGMTANSFTSVSLDPALVLVCVLRESALHGAILDSGEFAVSVLRPEQEHAARYFADRSRPRGDREFDPIESRPGPRTGAPILAGSLAWLECGLAAVYDGGDHSIFLGSVLDAGHEPDCAALLYHRGRFHHLSAA